MSIDSNLFDHDEDEQSKVDENNNNSFSLGGGLNYKKLVLNNDITPSKSSMKLQKTPKRSIKVPDINTKNMTQKVSVRFADDKSSPIRFPKK